MALRMVTVVLLAAAGALGLGACGGDSDKSSESPAVTMPSAAGGAAGIEVTAKEFSFDPAQLTLKAGVPARIVLKNIGSIEHDLTVGAADFKVTANGGKTKDKELEVERPGTYEFHCSLPGHKNAGMKGQLTVE